MTSPASADLQARASAVVQRTRVERGLPAAVEDADVLRKLVVLVESPVRAQQVERRRAS